MEIYPKNKHILVELIEDEDEGTAVILPDDYRPMKSHIVAKVLKVHGSVREEISEGSIIVAESNMLRDVVIHDETYYLIQANYVLCEVK
tara:strand:- start:238 stop:504 length:267 start_codon:yes stop_codon:yes gene_type:complete